nr:jasmonate ZIM domain-containing [Gastrodia elata]
MSFSLTCSRLSQYIKERGCPVDLRMPSRSLSGELSTHGVPTTMSLFPGNEVADANKTGKKDCISSLRATGNTEPQERAQLTIFYDGKVLVFDDFPPENAQYLMQLASKISLTRRLQISLPSFAGEGRKS